MAFSRLLHHHGAHRARQLRWVLPAVALLFLAALVTLLVQYELSDQAVQREFFRAHKTIGHTGELLTRGLVAGTVVLTLIVLALGGWALRLTHRIVRPVHTLHLALDALGTGDLGVRVELARADEFQEVGAALNRLVETFASTLGRIHALVDRIDPIAAAAARDRPAEARLHELVRELDVTMDFFRLEPRRLIREEDG